MRKIYLFIALLIATIAFIEVSNAATLSMKFQQTWNYFEEIEGEGWRFRPTKQLSCDIDSDLGLIFYDEEKPDILSYAINDETGACVGFFVDEFEFINYLFTLSGGYEIVLTTEEYNLVAHCGILKAGDYERRTYDQHFGFK